MEEFLRAGDTASVLDGAVTLVAAVVVSTLIWSFKGHFAFKAVPGRSSAFVVLSLAAVLLVDVRMWLSVQPEAAQWTGIALMGAGYLLFWAAVRPTRGKGLQAAFTPENPTTLVTDGPYRWVRHPFYSSYLLCWGGFAVASWSLSGAAVFAAIFAMYWKAARDEEAKFAAGPMADAYSSYARKAGRFFPRLARG